jgi:hypothetical protein
MDLSIRPSRSGTPTCAAAGLWLHSRYDPRSEALRFAESEIGSSKPSHVVLLGPCLDYLSTAVRSVLPSARIVSLQYSAFFAAAAIGFPDASWNPGSPISMGSFLDSALDEDAISGVAVLEWEPAARAFPAEALAAREALRISLDKLASSTATVKASGRLWIANACATFLLAERAWLATPTDIPILVAAAGPSLRRSLLEASRLGLRYATIAVSSALSACRAAGIEPDLVVATDGGYWSRLHLYPLVGESLPLASPLTALPSASIFRGTGLLPIDQGSFAESELLPALSPAIALPPHGTVSGTAIGLAARLTSGPIIAAGLDLASEGELDHARPHGFDPLREGSTSRIAPLESSSWSRVAESMPVALSEKPWRSSRSLTAYASALAQDSSALGGRLYRVDPSPVPLRGFAGIPVAELGAFAKPRLGSAMDHLELRATGLPPREERETFLRLRLAEWKELATSAAEGMRSGVLHSSRLVTELLRSVDIVDYAAARRAILSGGEPKRAAIDLGRRCDIFLSGLERRFAP